MIQNRQCQCRVTSQGDLYQMHTNDQAQAYVVLSSSLGKPLNQKHNQAEQAEFN